VIDAIYLHIIFLKPTTFVLRIRHSYYDAVGRLRPTSFSIAVVVRAMDFVFMDNYYFDTT